MPVGKAARYGFVNARCRTIRSQLVPAAMLEEMAEAKGVAELSSMVMATPYGAFISESSAEGLHRGLTEAFAFHRKRLIRELDSRHQETFSLFFERKYRLPDEKSVHIGDDQPGKAFLSIDKGYMEQLRTSMKGLRSVEQQQLKRIVGSYFDMLNLYNLVKFRLLYGHSVEETLTFMLPKAGRFTVESLAALCTPQTIEQLSEAAQPLLGERFDDYEGFRKALYRYHHRELLSVWSGYPFSIAIPFALLRMIEIEISNLRAITEGVEFGLHRDDIVAMIVGE